MTETEPIVAVAVVVVVVVADAAAVVAFAVVVVVVVVVVVIVVAPLLIINYLPRFFVYCRNAEAVICCSFAAAPFDRWRKNSSDLKIDRTFLPPTGLERGAREQTGGKVTPVGPILNQFLLHISRPFDLLKLFVCTRKTTYSHLEKLSSDDATLPSVSYRTPWCI